MNRPEYPVFYDLPIISLSLFINRLSTRISLPPWGKLKRISPDKWVLVIVISTISQFFVSAKPITRLLIWHGLEMENGDGRYSQLFFPWTDCLHQTSPLSLHGTRFNSRGIICCHVINLSGYRKLDFAVTEVKLPGYVFEERRLWVLYFLEQVRRSRHSRCY